MTAEELSDRLPHYNEFDGTMLAIKMLLRSGRITEEIHEGRLCYIPIDRHHNLYSQDWEVRIDALSEHLEAISETLRLRFLEENPSELSAARTFTFKANSEDIEEFREEVFEFIRRKYRKLEDKANLVELDNKSHNVNDESSQSTAHSNLDSIPPKSDKKLDIKTFSLYLGVTPIPHKESKS
jgi:hypothetical protein